MGLLLISLLSLALFVSPLFVIFKYRDRVLPKNIEPFLVGTATVNAFVLMFVLLHIVISYFSHKYDVGTVKSYHHKIAVYIDRADRLQRSLSQIVVNPASLSFNKDQPYSSIANEIAIAERDLLRTRRNWADACVSIARRLEGPTGFLVKPDEAIICNKLIAPKPPPVLDKKLADTQTLNFTL